MKSELPKVFVILNYDIFFKSRSSNLAFQSAVQPQPLSAVGLNTKPSPINDKREKKKGKGGIKTRTLAISYQTIKVQFL